MARDEALTAACKRRRHMFVPLASQTQLPTGAMLQLYQPFKRLLGQKVESVEGTQRKKGLSVRTEDRSSGGDVGGFSIRERDSSIHEV